MSAPLTPLMRQILDALDALRTDSRLRIYPSTPNRIAIEMGLDSDVRRQGNGAAGRGGWAGVMAPSQRIIFPLTALRKRGLVYLCSRPDGMSGTAYGLTDEGKLEIAETLAAP